MRHGGRVLAGSVAAVIGAAGLLGAGAPAQAGAPGYAVVPLAPLSGRAAYGASINDRGLVSGTSSTRVGTTHAVLWRDGTAVDLGTAGGPGASSAVLWPAKNNSGLVVGVTETNDPDPNDEAWSCGNFMPRLLGRACRGFVWRDGHMRTLPTLGGTHSFATGANARGQVVGWAENAVRDPSCTDTQVLQFRAVVWSPGRYIPTELVPLTIDSTSAATAINDNGLVVGISGECDKAVGRLSAAHAVLWRDGQPTRLEDLGGLAWNTPMAVNNEGVAVGFVNPSAADGTAFRAVPASWTPDGTIHQLALPAGYVYGQALGINDGDTIVGVGYTSSFDCAALVWSGGRARVLTDQTLDLCSANDINNRGQVTGRAHDPVTDADVGFLATPRVAP